MKKHIFIIFALAFLVVLSACANKDDGKNTDSVIDTADLINHSVSADENFLCIEGVDGCYELKEYVGAEEIVVIPEMIEGKYVTSVGTEAFSNADTVKAVKLADTVIEIQKGAFSNNTSLEIVVCGTRLENINEKAFESCTSLKKIVMNDGLLSIGASAFSASGLEEVFIPSSVTKLEGAFENVCDNFVINGNSGSFAEEYAKSAGITFNGGFE